MKYCVKYRAKGIQKNGNHYPWKSIENVTGDGFVPAQFAIDPRGKKIPVANFPMRFFEFEDKTRIELNIFDYEFEFPPERHLSIKEKEEKQTGTPLN